MLQLTPDLRIVTDKLNVILQERKVTKKDSKEYWEAVAYAYDYKDMLHTVITRKTKGVDSLIELNGRIEELHTMVDDLARYLSRLDTLPKDIVTGDI